MGGNVTDNNSSSRYKIIVESGKYSSILGFNSSSYSYSGIVYLVLGNDVDRAKGNNQNMSVYFELTVSRGNGSSGNSNNDKAFLIDTIRHEQDLYEKITDEMLNFELDNK